MHTFLFAPRVEPDEVFKKMCRRIAYLRDKFIEDMRTAEKIFVYRSATIDADGLSRLHRAMRAHGPVTLLGVQPIPTAASAFQGSRAGDVVQLDDGLYAGFLAHARNDDASGATIIDLDSWTHIAGTLRKQSASRMSKANAVTHLCRVPPGEKIGIARAFDGPDARRMI